MPFEDEASLREARMSCGREFRISGSSLLENDSDNSRQGPNQRGNSK